jgi:hypothetical protein
MVVEKLDGNLECVAFPLFLRKLLWNALFACQFLGKVLYLAIIYYEPYVYLAAMLDLSQWWLILDEIDFVLR